MKNCYQICPLTRLLFMLADFMSCLTDWDILVCISGTFSAYSYTLSCLLLQMCLLQDPSNLLPLLRTFVKLFAVTAASCLLMICHSIKNAVDNTVCSLLKCCMDNSVKFSTGETLLISFTYKTKITDFKYKSHSSLMIPSMSRILQYC
jgi:hypothetical protein